jgi:hypothetical protein
MLSFLRILFQEVHYGHAVVLLEGDGRVYRSDSIRIDATTLHLVEYGTKWMRCCITYRCPILEQVLFAVEPKYDLFQEVIHEIVEGHHDTDGCAQAVNVVPDRDVRLGPGVKPLAVAVLSLLVHCCRKADRSSSKRTAADTERRAEIKQRAKNWTMQYSCLPFTVKRTKHVPCQTSCRQATYASNKHIRIFMQ